MYGERIYHIMIDRFFPSGMPDSTGNFRGGRIHDIINRLDYIRSLGMTGIMLTPFYKTAAYHGYHIVDFKQVDPHFGSKNDLRELIEEVHARQMSIVADFVANHCHKDCSLFSDGKHEDWFLYDKSGKCRTYANLPDLPMFNTANVDVQKYLTERALNLCRMGFDAIRLDHAAGPDYDFWKYFATAIKHDFPDVKLIGEVWGKLDFKPHNRIKYLQNHIRYGAQEARQLEYVGVLDGVLDFRFYQIVCEAIHTGRVLTKNSKLYGKVKQHFNRYPDDFKLWLFLDNHDLNRILFECGGNAALVADVTEFTLQWGKTFLMFYGTEKGLTNTVSIFDGTPYADERVRQCLR